MCSFDRAPVFLKNQITLFLSDRQFIILTALKHLSKGWCIIVYRIMIHPVHF